MKAYLLFPDREWKRTPGYLDSVDIIKDLNLEILFRTAGYACDIDSPEKGGQTPARDEYLVGVMRRIMMEPLKNEEEVLYRQKLIKETLHNYNRMNDLCTLARHAEEEIELFSSDKKQKLFRSGGQDQNRLLVTELDFLNKLVTYLDREKEILLLWEDSAEQEEMKTFIANFLEEYNNGYQKLIHEVLLDIRGAMTAGNFVISGCLGAGFNLSEAAVGTLMSAPKKNLILNNKVVEMVGRVCQNLVSKSNYSTEIDEIQLKQDVEELKSAALASVIRRFVGFAEDTTNYFQQLAFQTSFYIGAVNLYHRVQRFSVPLSFPKVCGRETLVFNELTELSLAILSHSKPVANTFKEKEKQVFVITGANQGGKSTFLRSVAVAQVMMQSGLFVAARSYESGLYKNVFTHFSRREDSAMNSGRLDEELSRMERIIDNISEDSILFLNESFATTTEKEGSMIANDITKALYENNIRVMMVTHLLTFARDFYKEQPEHVVFLTAERVEDGKRTYKMIEHAPEETSYGLDLYDDLIQKDQPKKD